jgi:heptaprenyl diphosphate synthase
MWAASVLFRRILSPVGISLLGALTHNIAQLLLAYLFFVRRIEAIAYITPIIILLGTLTGFINGLVTCLIIKRFKETAMTGYEQA